ncbi:MAG TPA: alkaline phosphatase, partial [Ruminococcaceae bacterium]|nr:alkaline phosphatase [Oscillospiraceae bacterium]
TGFFLMVEGGAIDLAGHEGNKNRNIGETLEFDKAVKAALDFAAQDGNTLVVVTADHETGGLKYKETTKEYYFTSG